MKVVVDTSAVMSAIMSKNGRVADVLLNPIFEFELIRATLCLSNFSSINPNYYNIPNSKSQTF